MCVVLVGINKSSFVFRLRSHKNLNFVYSVSEHTGAVLSV